MLYYFNATDKQLRQLEKGNDLKMNGKPLDLETSLRKARRSRDGHVLAIDPDALGKELRGKSNAVRRIPGDAVLNARPFKVLRQTVAGGGIVTRMKDGKLQVLLIYRRGKWDLPKGKRNRGESNRECALREVKEELGISRLKVIQPLDTTLHGFEQSRWYRLKTTHWYHMKTNATEFVPEAAEGIEKVKWFKWKKAVKKLGYKTLQDLMNDVEETVRQATN